MKDKKSVKLGIKHTLRGDMTVHDISSITGVTANCLRGRGDNYGYDSVVMFWPRMARKEFYDRAIAEGLRKPFARSESSLKRLHWETKGTDLTYLEISVIVDRTSSVIREWVTRHGCQTVEDISARLEYLDIHPNGGTNGAPQFVPPSREGIIDTDMSSKKNMVKSSFNALEHCSRQDHLGFVTHKCRHYSECGDSRAFYEVHSKRYDPSGKCYDGEVLKVTKVPNSYRLIVECLTEITGR